MSYCRWSSDWGDCDVYVYADVSGGYTTHVAGRRRKHRVPDEIRQMVPPVTDSGWVDGYMAADKARKEWEDQFPKDEYGYLADSEYLDLSEIGPEAGEGYNDSTPGACADRLEELKARGFNVPQYAIDSLREEEE